MRATGLDADCERNRHEATQADDVRHRHAGDGEGRAEAARTVGGPRTQGVYKPAVRRVQVQRAGHPELQARSVHGWEQALGWHLLVDPATSSPRPCWTATDTRHANVGIRSTCHPAAPFHDVNASSNRGRARRPRWARGGPPRLRRLADAGPARAAELRAGRAVRRDFAHRLR